MEGERLKDTTRAALIRLLCAVLAVALGVGILIWRKHQPEQSASADVSEAEYEITVTDPTCTEGGFSTYRDKATGRTEIRDEVPALGHDWGAWETLTAQEGVEPGLQRHVCAL